MSGDVSDLVERLRHNADDCEDDSRWATPELAPLLRAAATALEAKEAEIAALEDLVSLKHEALLAEISSAEASAETAERYERLYNDEVVERLKAERERDEARAALKLSQTALALAAARFNLMGGVGLVNGADPRVGYRDAMAAATAARAVIEK